MLTDLSKRRGAGSQDLVDLLAECHARIRRFAGLARDAAARRDAPVDQVVQACGDVDRYFREALPLHVADEEESIAPRLRGLSPEVDQALDAMVQQHQEHLRKLEAVLQAIAAVRREPHQGRARDALAAVAEDLETDFAAHLALEESVIFPAIQRLLPRETQDGIIDELRQRRRHHGPGRGAPSAVTHEVTPREHEALNLMAQLGAGSIAHPGGTLLSHLERTRGLLAEWGAPEALRLAGACHAAYGTDGFDVSLIARTDRRRLEGVIGQPAEGLVYLYGACARAASYPTLDGNMPCFVDRFDGRRVTPSRRAVQDFVELTVANELDVMTHRAELAAQLAPGLVQWFQRWRGLMSPAAQLAVECWRRPSVIVV